MSTRSITCPTCSHGFVVPAEARTAVCPRCGRALPILAAQLGLLGSEGRGNPRPEGFEDLPSTVPGLPRQAPATNAELADPTLPDPPRPPPLAVDAASRPVAIPAVGTGVDLPARPPGAGILPDPHLAEENTAEELPETALDWPHQRRAEGAGEPEPLPPLQLVDRIEPASQELPDDPTIPLPAAAPRGGPAPWPAGLAGTFHRDLTPSARFRVLSSAIEDEVGKHEDLAAPLFPHIEPLTPLPEAPSAAASASGPLQASPSSPVALIDTPPAGSSPTLPRGVRSQAAPVPVAQNGIADRAPGRQSGGIAVVLPSSPVEEVPLPRETARSEAGPGHASVAARKERSPLTRPGPRRRRGASSLGPDVSAGLGKPGTLLLAGAAMALLLGLLAWLLLR